MSMVRFALYTLVGSLVWNAILCTLGFWAGGAWEQITAQAEWVSDVVKVVIIVVAVGVVAWWVKFQMCIRDRPDTVKWGPEKWSPDYRNKNRIETYDTGTAPCLSLIHI